MYYYPDQIGVLYFKYIRVSNQQIYMCKKKNKIK